MNEFWANLINGIVRDIVIPAIVAALLALLADILVRVRAYLRAKYGNEMGNLLWNLTLKFVRAAEQIYGAGNGPKKYIFVRDALQRELEMRYGLRVDLAELQTWIEAAVIREFPKYQELHPLTANHSLPEVMASAPSS